MTAAELKLLLETPLALFLLMLAGSLGSVWKQMVVARRGGAVVSVRDYFLKNWPETVGMLGHNAIAFVTLIFTDQLGWAAAIGLGYIANDAADAYTKEGRSISIGTPKQGGYARVAMLVFLTAIAAMALQACTTTPADVIKPACTTESKYQVERCAKAWAETYEVYQKRALEMVQNPSTPAEIRVAVQQAEALASRAVIELTRGGAAFIRIRDEVAAGTTQQEQLAIATANLDRYIALVDERITALIDALSGRAPR